MTKSFLSHISESPCHFEWRQHIPSNGHPDFKSSSSQYIHIKAIFSQLLLRLLRQTTYLKKKNPGGNGNPIGFEQNLPCAENIYWCGTFRKSIPKVCVNYGHAGMRRESLYWKSQLVDLLRHGTSCMNAKSRWNMIPNLMRNFCWWTWRAPKLAENPWRFNGWNILMEVWWKGHVPWVLWGGDGWKFPAFFICKRELFFQFPNFFRNQPLRFVWEDASILLSATWNAGFFQRLVMPMPSSFLIDVGIINTFLYFFKARHEVSTTYYSTVYDMVYVFRIACFSGWYA